MTTHEGNPVRSSFGVVFLPRRVEFKPSAVGPEGWEAYKSVSSLREEVCVLEE